MQSTAERSKAENAQKLTRPELRRYARHLVLPEVGLAGQQRLRQARVLLVGAGGLGSPAALYLAAAGVGTLGVVEFDTVDESNLQRQILHGSSDVGRPKLESARDRLTDVNPHTRIEAHPHRLSAANASEVIREYDVVVDGTDNFPTRYLVNDVCVWEGKPNVHGSVFRWEGQASVFWAERGPCYRCLFPQPPAAGTVPNCAEGGVLGVLPGIIGTIQATETIKLVLGAGNRLIGRLLIFDAMCMSFHEVKLLRDPECPVCGDDPMIHEPIDYDAFCGATPSSTPTTSMEQDVPEMTVSELKQRLDRGDRLTIVDVREPYEWQIGNLEEYGAQLIPLGDLPNRLAEISSGGEVVLLCRSGRRSEDALKLMRERGYPRLWNLEGGMLAWSDQIDPSIPKY